MIAMKRSSSLPSIFAVALIAGTILGGCGGDDMPATESASNNLKQVGLAQQNYGDARPAAGGAGAGQKEPAGKAKTVAAPRKIIYDARVALLVESLATAEQAVSNLIKEHDGFLAESDQSSATSAQRRATWRMRRTRRSFRAVSDRSEPPW